MKMKPHITRPAALWSGATLLVLGLIVASIAIWGTVRSRDAEVIADELRAKGAIVENYYKVIGRHYPPLSSPSSPTLQIIGYLSAGVLAVAGSILLWKAPSFPKNHG